MKKSYIVEVKKKGKWCHAGRYECDKKELLELRKSMQTRLDNPTNSEIRQFRIKLELEGK